MLVLHSPHAARAYGSVALEAQLAAASPHRLVALLYARLASLLREAAGARAAGDTARRARATERALAIIEGLDATLDHERGGEVAATLATIYDVVRDRLLDGGEPALREAAASIAAIGEAWERIGR